MSAGTRPRIRSLIVGNAADRHNDGSKPARSCAGCTLCCFLLAVEEISKPALTECRHCTPGICCNIYGERPQQCRTYSCGYLQIPEVPDHWEPRRSKMVLQSVDDPPKIVVHVHPDWPRAWEAVPYYGDLRTWSAAAIERGAHVYVVVGSSTTIILPDRDVELGVLEADDLIEVVSLPGAGGVRRFVYTRKPGGPAKGSEFWR